MINNKFQSFTMAIVALAFIFIAAERAYSLFVPKANAYSTSWVCATYNGTRELTSHLQNKGVIEVALGSAAGQDMVCMKY